MKNCEFAESKSCPRAAPTIPVSYFRSENSAGTFGLSDCPVPSFDGSLSLDVGIAGLDHGFIDPVKSRAVVKAFFSQFLKPLDHFRSDIRVKFHFDRAVSAGFSISITAISGSAIGSTPFLSSGVAIISGFFAVTAEPNARANKNKRKLFFHIKT